MTRRVHPHTDHNTLTSTDLPDPHFHGSLRAQVPIPEHRNPRVTRAQQREGRGPTAPRRRRRKRWQRLPFGGSCRLHGPSAGGRGWVGGQQRGRRRGSLAGGQRSCQQGAVPPQAGAGPRPKAPPPRDGDLPEMGSGVKHCLLLFKASALPQFHHVLRSRAAHAASRLLDPGGRRPHAHSWAQPEPARHAHGWQPLPSCSVPDIDDRNK